MGTYEFDGEKYEKASKHQREWGTRLIAECRLKGDEEVLDLGCGDGSLTSRIAELVPDGRVLGIDASEGMLKEANKKAGGNLEFALTDINKMSFESEFDLIFSNAALHWVSDHSALLFRSCRALKPGGRIMWNFASDGTCRNFFAVVKSLMLEEKYAEYFTGFEWPFNMPAVPDFEKLAEKIGFSSFFAKEENEDRYFSDAAEMIRWLNQPCLVPFLSRLPESLKPEFAREAEDAMLIRTLKKDGTFYETFRRLYFGAVK